jgi:hypothetical protein
MRGRFLVFCLGAGATLAFACTDELVEDVPPEVCYSEHRWVGGKHGHPEMYPGRDCVGCHLENDGPPLAIGGTIYAHTLGFRDNIDQLQTGEDCFGLEGVNILVTDDDDQPFQMVTNRAGNFYVEGNPDDFAKPFNAQLSWTNDDGTPGKAQMTTAPVYGGCAHCHDPSLPPTTDFQFTPTDPDYQNPQPRIGLPGFRDKQIKALSPAVAP